VTAYQGKQLKWFVGGAVVVVLSAMGLAYLGLSQAPDVLRAREQLSISQTHIALSAFWTFAEVVLAAWLATKMREEAPAVARSGS
jgi:hypothetical protein